MLRTTILSATLAGLALAAVPALPAQEYSLRLTKEKEEADNVKEVAELPAYWIGVALRDTDPALLEHLKLEHGILVGEVIPDSPAAKAGLQSLDIITRAGESDIKSGEDLLKAVATAKDGELTIKLYRRGAEQSVKVTPAKRPPQDRVAPMPPLAVEAKPREAVEKALRLWKGTGPLEFDLVQPGVVMRLDIPSLPDDMEVTVQRKGKNPPKVTVKQGEGNSWTATGEKEIDTLPEAARPIVRQMLGQQTDHLFWSKVNPPSAPNPPAVPHVRVLPPRTVEGRDSRDVLERIDAELKKLQEQLDQLRKDKATKQ